ncbi:MAG: ATPase domain-containing protein [Candidatus Woesearchaeota archaeon]
MAKILNFKLERDQLQEKLGNGLPSNSIIVIEGPDGGGKSVLCERFTYGLLENKISVTYISSEMNTADFINQMNSLNYNIVDRILNEELLFIPMFPFFGSVEFDENFMENLFKADYIYKNQVIIFDSFSDLILKDKTKKTIFEIVDFFKRLISMDKTLIITFNPALLDDEITKILKSIADVLFHVELRERYGELVNFIDIVRFKLAKDRTDKQIPFRVDPGVGIAIEITA